MFITRRQVEEELRSVKAQRNILFICTVLLIISVLTLGQGIEKLAGF